MGWWGVKAHESDRGLDLLWVVKDSYLCEREFKHFNIKEVVELLKNHIKDKILKTTKKWEQEDENWGQEQSDEYYEDTFSYDYGVATMLVAECFADYLENGSITVYDDAAEKDRKITKVIYAKADLEALGLAPLISIFPYFIILPFCITALSRRRISRLRVS